MPGAEFVCVNCGHSSWAHSKWYGGKEPDDKDYQWNHCPD